MFNICGIDLKGEFEVSDGSTSKILQVFSNHSSSGGLKK